MTKKISPAELKENDVFIMPKPSHAGVQHIKVVSNPVIGETEVGFFGKRMLSKVTEDTFQATEYFLPKKDTVELVLNTIKQ